MAKLASFFRRIFTSVTSDDDFPSSQSRRSIVIIPPLTPPSISTSKITSQIPTNTSRSCSASPQPSSRTIIKQTTIQIDGNNGNSHLNFLSSNIPKPTNRRLSAPLIIHASTFHRQHRSAIVHESTEEALISPLQRLSLSSTAGISVCHNNSVNSLGTSATCSTNASPRIDARSSSFNLSSSNSINLPSSLNNISPASGRC
jgi:hypothetical protein